MKKLKRLIEIKRQTGLAIKRQLRAESKLQSLKKERDKILDSITKEEWNLYKEQVEKACRL